MDTRLIRQRELQQDTWQRVEHFEDLPTAAAGLDILVPLAQWLADPVRWRQAVGRIGVALEPADAPELLTGQLADLALITVNFPSFTDGRGYSTARLLRERLGFQGELRAIGDVFRDVLFNLARVGFDAFLLRPGESASAALPALDTFSESYQAAVDTPLPLFRRRLA